MATAGLSRAYAVLHQLDVLRTDDILHPVPLSSPSRRRRRAHVFHEGEMGVNGEQSGTALCSHAERWLQDRQLERAYGGESWSPLRQPISAPKSQKADSAPLSTQNKKAGNSHCPSGSSPLEPTTGDEYLMQLSPSCSDAMSAALLGSTAAADTRFVSRVSPSEARPATHAYAPRSCACSLRRGQSPAVHSRFYTAPSSIGADVQNFFHNPGHVYLRHSPKSSPHRSHVLSPVVLPALSTSEVDHILAHASSTLENYFDKDDMQSVLASVAAAARQADLRSHHPFSVPQPTSAVAAARRGAFGVSKRPYRAARKSTNGRKCGEWKNSPDLDDIATSTSSVSNMATLSSLTHSPTSRPADVDYFCTTRGSDEAERSRRAQHTHYKDESLWQLRSPPIEGDGTLECPKPITITPSMERLLEAVQCNSRYMESDWKDKEETSTNSPMNYSGAENSPDVSAPSHWAKSSRLLDEQFSQLEVTDSPRPLTHEQHRFSPNLSSFYTANRPSLNDANGERRDSTAQTLARPAAAASSSSPTPNIPHEYYPIPAPLDALSTMRRDVLLDHSSEEESDEVETGDQNSGTKKTCSAMGSSHAESNPPNARSEVVANEKKPMRENNEGDDSDDGHKEEELKTEDTVSTVTGNKEVDSVNEIDYRNNCNKESQKAPLREENTPSGAQPSTDDNANRTTNSHSSDFPAKYTHALPFLDYLARVNAAPADVLLKELAAMGDAWAASSKTRLESANKESESRDSERAAVERDDDEVVDCLALSLLLNKPAALQHIAVPLLRAQLKNLLRLLRDLEKDGRGRSRSPVRTLRTSVGLDAMREESESDIENDSRREGKRRTKSPAAVARATHFNNVLCATIGLGCAASTLLPLLLQLLLQLPPPTPDCPCNARLVGLAIRTCGAAEGLRALTRIVEEQREAVHVLTAAAYALSTYAYELAGHTSVVCVPANTMQCACEEALYRLVPDKQLAFSSHRFSPSAPSLAAVESELRPLWSGSTMLTPIDSPSAAAAATPTGIGLLYLQSPPPYCPTHIVIDAEAARRSLQMYMVSDVFSMRRDHPYAMVLLDDALNSSLLCQVLAEPSGECTYKPIWDRKRRDLHHVICSDQSATGNKSNGAAARGLQLPLLLYSFRDFFADEKDMLFAVESALVHALVSRPAPLFQEQALMSLSILPPEARVHVVQPVTDFLLKVVRRYQLRDSTTMRRARATAKDGSHTRYYDDYGGAEGTAEEALVVAATVAAGTVCVNPLTPTSCTSSCIAALVPILAELLQTSQWRVRHAACIGLARVGPYTTDPTAVVDMFLSLLTPAGSSSFLANAVPSESHQPILQPATVVWCLAQQQQGGVRALLRVLQDARESPPVHNWCAFQLADVDVYEACQEENQTDTPESDALLDELVQVLGKLIATQGALEENTVLLCVRALAEVVNRAAASAVTWRVDASSSTVPCILPLQAEQLEQEAATYYEREPLNSCFTVLTSVMEAALLPTNVLKALCLYLCKYGGAHGELYVCEMLLESSSVAARSAAAFGLRACGAKVIRSVVLGMNDTSFEVRREALDTMDVIGAADVLAVLRHRPAEHRHQVLAALRDCLLQDAGRSVTRKAADTVYRTLANED